MHPAVSPLSGPGGLLLVTGNVFLEQLGVPIPAIPTLVLAGAIASRRLTWGVALFFLSTLACVVADSVWFAAGRHYGNRVMRLLCTLSLSPDSCVSETQLRFERWGSNALLVAKFVPGLAVIAPPLAGALGMSWPRFLARSSAGGALWVLAYLLIGAVFEVQINYAVRLAFAYGKPMLALAILSLVIYVAFRWWARRRFLRLLRMGRISVSELYELIAAGSTPVVVDLRSHTARTVDPRVIPGALHVAPDAVDRHVHLLPRDKDIILYCNCPNEASAARVAKLLTSHGFARVRPLAGGLDAWVAAGYAVDAAHPAVTTAA